MLNLIKVDDMSTFFMGIIAGFITSFLIWILTTKLLSPRLTLLKKVARTKLEDNSRKYFIKIINESRTRDIYDISCYIRFHFRDGAYYSMETPTLPLLTKNTSSENNKKYHFERLIEIKRIKKGAGTVYTLDDFFENEGEKCVFEVIIVCYDKFSGAKKCIRSQEFGKGDIEDGRFRPGKKCVESVESYNAQIEMVHGDHN